MFKFLLGLVILVLTLGGHVSPALAQDMALAQGSRLPESAYAPEIQQILERGTLVVAMLDQENPPFFMTSPQHQLVGLDINLAQDLADRLGVKLRLHRTATTFDQVVNAVFRGEADMAISKISRTLNRGLRVRFSRPYLEMRQGLLVNRILLTQQAHGSTMTETLRRLQGKVGVIQGSSYVEFLRQKFPLANVVEFGSWPRLVDAVTAGEILAAYRDELEIKQLALTRPNAALNLQTVALTDTRDALAIVLPWDSPQLLAFVDQYLAASATDYTVDALLQRYADDWLPQTRN